jgi:hypothetical protein
MIGHFRLLVPLIAHAASLSAASTLAFQSSSPPAKTSMSIVLPRVIGHRGAKSIAPENTLASIRAAKRVGAKFVEVDVMLSKDKVDRCYVIIMIHAKDFFLLAFE